MQCLIQLDAPYTTLNPEDCGIIVSHLDASLAVLDKMAGRPTIDEIKIKSMLAVLRSEIKKAARIGSTPPCGFSA
jgi:hypothetical protein